MKPPIVILAFIGILILHYLTIKDVMRSVDNPYFKKVFVLNDDGSLKTYEIPNVSPN